MNIIEELEKILKNTSKEELERIWSEFGEDTENDIFIEDYLEIVNSYKFAECDTKFGTECFKYEIDETCHMDQAA